MISLTIIRYRRLYIPLALAAMALHRLPLWVNKKCLFWKLLGSGKNGTFDLKPDWQQWALLAVWKDQEDFNRFYKYSIISKWWKMFAQEQYTILLETLSSYGKWDNIEPFIIKKNNKNYNGEYVGPVAVLTRATIRFKQLKSFWRNVEKVAVLMNKAPGYIISFGIGETPVYRQATFSIWKTLDDVKNFAYRSKEHGEVIQKTRKEDWYSEELFARFKPIATIGTIKGVNPLENLNIPLVKI